MSRKAPTREDWSELRATISEWYKNRTANWIAEELKRQGWNVTPKMLRDRFKEWGLDPKYNRHAPRRQRGQAQRHALAARPAVDNVNSSNATTIFQQDDLQAHSTHHQSAGCLLMPVDPPPRVPATTLAAPVLLGLLPHAQVDYFGLLPTHTPRTAPNGTPVFFPGAPREEVPTSSYNNIVNVELLNPANTLITPEPSRTPDTPPENRHLHFTLSSIHSLLDRIVEMQSWRYTVEKPCMELQKLAANTNMAITSQAYDCHQIWRELADLKGSAQLLLPRLYDPGRDIHPRVLTILLRLIVNGRSKPLWELEALSKVRYMFSIVASGALRKTHPVTLLLRIPSDQAHDLLWRQIQLVKTRFYARAKGEDPTFVANEEIYCARVLASLGYLQEADVELQSVIGSLAPQDDQYTLADAHRTLGYSKCQSAMSDEAQGKLAEARSKYVEACSEDSYALDIFERIGKGTTENAMYTHFCLSWASRGLEDLASSEEHLWAAWRLWQLNRKEHDSQGSVKLVRELDQVLRDQSKFTESKRLQREHAKYFEESPATH